MYSVTKPDWKFFPLCTRNVCPTKSGVTIERRDQVLIGFFAPELFILSIFSRRCDSTKGPFFNDLAINVKFCSRPALSGRRWRGDRAPRLHYVFFFDFLLSKMNRSLGLCLVRVLKPLASCPQGLTG